MTDSDEKSEEKSDEIVDKQKFAAGLHSQFEDLENRDYKPDQITNSARNYMNNSLWGDFETYKQTWRLESVSAAESHDDALGIMDQNTLQIVEEAF